MAEQIAGVLPARSVGLTACPYPFSTQRKVTTFGEGMSITDVLVENNFDRKVWDRTRVTIDGVRIKPEYWHVVHPKAGTRVVIRVTPGSDETVRSVALIAVAVLATYAGQYYLANVAGASAFGAAAITAGVAVAGSLAVNALIPLEVPDTYNEDLRPGYGISGSQNRYAPFAAVPIIFGTHRSFPPHATKPYTEIVGNDQYLRQCFVVGHKDLNISSLKIGDNDLTSFEGVSWQIVCGGDDDTDAAITIIPNQVNEVSYTIQMNGLTGEAWEFGEAFYYWHEFTTSLDADEFSIDFTALQGLIRIQQDGDRRTVTVPLLVEYRETASPAGSWTRVGDFSIAGQTSNVVRKGFTYAFPSRGQYDVRVCRTTFDSSGDYVGGGTLIDDVWITAFRSIKNEPPVLHDDAALIALRIKSSEQLNGVVSTFNCVASSILPDWNGSSWVTRETQNPASCFRAVLQGVGNAKPVADSRIDLDALQEWHEECEAEGRTYNFEHTNTATVWDTLKQIARAGRARPTQIDGLWTVVRDKAQTTPVQHFSPLNSWNFSGTRNYRVMPHGWRFRFVNEEQDYQTDERIIYDDGYTESNATLFETISVAGVTNPDHVWKEGRYHLAVARLRPETFTFTTDFGNLACTQGDLVFVADDSIKVGLGSGWITGVTTSGSNITGIVLDTYFDMETGKTYVLRVRKSDGSSAQLQLFNWGTGSYKYFILSTPVAISGGPAVGNLAMYGELDLEYMPMVVDSILPGPDLTATLKCYPYNDAIYTADTGTIPAYSTYITNPAGVTQPVLQSIQSDEWVMLRAADGTLQPRILVAFGFSGNRENVSSIELQYRVYGTEAWETMPSVPWYASGISINNVYEGETYELRARYLFIGGNYGQFTSPVQHTVIGKTSLPPDVTIATVVRQPDGTREFRAASAVIPPDFAGYVIRYASGTDAPYPDWDDMTPLHTGVIKSFPWETNQLTAGDYTLAFKQEDTSGNQSANPLYIVSTLGDPRSQNILVNDDFVQSGWGGTKTGCYIDVVTGNLIPGSDDTWADIPATWAAWTVWNSNPSDMTYEGTGGESAYYDLGGVITVTPLFTVETVGNAGTITREVRYKNNLGDAWSAWISVDAADSPFTNTITARYIQPRITVVDPAVLGISRAQFILSADTISEYHNDFDMATDDTASPHVVGDVRLPLSKSYALIIKVGVVLQGVGANTTWRLVDRDPTLGPRILVYSSSSLADLTIDYEIIGLSGDAGTGTPASPLTSYLLLETSDSLLLESGDHFLLENA